MTDIELKNALDNKFGSLQPSLLDNATLAWVGDDNGVVDVPGRQGYIYVKTGNAPAVEVFNKRLIPQANQPVWIGYDPLDRFQLQVLANAVVQLDAYNGYRIGTVGPHAAQHAFLGGDPVFIEKRQYLPGRIGPASGSAGMAAVEVRGDVIYTAGQFLSWGTQDLDLTSYIPAASGSVINSRYVTISVSGSGTLVATSGSTVAGDTPSLSMVPAWPEGNLLLGAVRLYSGMLATSDGLQTDFLDVRTMYAPSGGGASSTLPYVTSGSVASLPNSRQLVVDTTTGLAIWDDTAHKQLVLSNGYPGHNIRSGGGMGTDWPYMPNLRFIGCVVDNSTYLATTTVTITTIINDNIWVAKGDIVAASGSGVAQRHAVGVDTSILTADSTKSDGLDWKVPDGWRSYGDTWTFVSGSTVNVSGSADVTALYPEGCKVKWNDAAQKYGYVVGATYSGSTTTLTFAGNSLSGSAITGNAFSFESSPLNFPHWFDWVPVFTGFSVNPTGIFRFKLEGRMVTVAVRMTADGTSGSGASGSGFTMSAPVTSTSITGMSWTMTTIIRDNGTSQTTPGRVYILTNSKTLVLTKDCASGTWTSSAGKSANFMFEYET